MNYFTDVCCEYYLRLLSFMLSILFRLIKIGPYLNIISELHNNSASNMTNQTTETPSGFSFDNIRCNTMIEQMVKALDNPKIATSLKQQKQEQLSSDSYTRVGSSLAFPSTMPSVEPSAGPSSIPSLIPSEG